jgi:GR25 family glycosyltransferase involved in LPS biosynthesis|tara:strand:- start:718 stop:1533 length:816 start_codon:yes stop_codon:yes gene_type:complete
MKRSYKIAALLISILVLKVIQLYFFNSNGIIKTLVRKVHTRDVPYGVFVINLERRRDRLETFLKHFDNSDLKNHVLVRHPAVDGSKLDIENLSISPKARKQFEELAQSKKRKHHYQFPDIGAFGCYLSHTQLFEITVKNNHTYSIVFEDDFHCPPNILKTIDSYLRTIPDDWDMLLINFTCHDCKKIRKYRKVTLFWGLGAYVISQKGARKLLNSGLLFPMTQQIDFFLSEMSSEINIYALPVSIGKTSGTSDIQTTNACGDEIWERYLLK